MTLRSLFAAALTAAAVMAAGAVSAQDTSPPPINGGLPGTEGVAVHGGQAGMAATTPSRIRSSRREMNRGVYNASDNPDFPTDPAIIRRDAQGAMDRSSERCQVSDATIVGAGADNTPIFETICAGGVGFIVVSGTQGVAVECGALAAATSDRSARRDMDVVSECRMPGNQMTAARITGYAREAGVACEIRAAAQIGRTGDG